MKIVIPSWGLGNVMFQYAFLCELRARGGGKEPCCFLLHKQLQFDHQGYELQKLFKKVQPYKGLNPVQRAYIHFVERLASAGFPGYFLFVNLFFKWKGVDEHFIYYDEVFRHPGKNLFFKGTWQSPKYFATARQEVIDTFCFDPRMTSAYTQRILRDIEAEPCSVGIHVRRGDYLKPEFEDLGRCCTIDYYRRAVSYFTDREPSARFFVFSDDMDYVRANLGGGRFVYVDGNRGADSWQDMYLMSRCRHNIIANSTFSWWGAFLNAHQDKTVIAPRRWSYNLERDEVTPDEWIRL